MKNKLLLTSALISGLSVIGSASFAETKITGEIKTGYKSGETVTVGAGRNNGFFRESQINVTKSGDLNNGLKYVAGFSFESDGDDTAGAQPVSGKTVNSIVTSNEGFYIQINSGDTGVLIGMDKAPTVDQSAAPRVAENVSTAIGNYAAATYDSAQGKIDQAMGVALIQKTPFGQVSVNFVEDTTDAGTGDSKNPAAGGGNNAYEIVFRGKPIKAAPGLDVLLGYSSQTDAVASPTLSKTADTETTVISAGYNFGKFAIGADRRNFDNSGAIGKDIKQTEISATAAVSDNVSIGIGKIEIDNNTLALDEEITYLQVGYNMGAIFSSFGMFDVENGAGQAANEGKMYTARLGVKF
jgi:hypothetical protein